jgi:transcriptional regulator with XRE-family HTH domain
MSPIYKTIKAIKGINMAKHYSAVMDMVRDISSDKSFASDLNNELENRQISKALFVMRCKAGLTQKQMAGKMKCSQAKISKIESSQDTRLSISDLADYCSALGMRLEIGFSDMRMSMVDKVKWHFFKLKGLIDEMLNMAKGDETMERGVAKFTTEAFVNITVGLLDCMKRAKHKIMQPQQTIHVSEPVKIEDLQAEQSADLQAALSK